MTYNSGRGTRLGRDANSGRVFNPRQVVQTTHAYEDPGSEPNNDL